MKTKLFFVLLFFISLFAISMQAQDSRIYIGKAWLRFDSDSARLRIGGNPIPKLARELDAQLFDFNVDQFAWDRSKGLCLRSISQYDTTKTRKLIIFADTGDGELIQYRSRSYTIYKPYYSNTPDLYDLLLRYVSYNDITGKSTMNDINLLNTTSTLFVNLQQTDITGMGYVPAISAFPRMGNYIVTVNYEYEFAGATDDGEDDINMVLSFDNNELRNYHHRWRHARTDVNNLRLSASITVPVSVTNISQLLSITLFGNNTQSSQYYLYNLSVTAVLIN